MIKEEKSGDGSQGLKCRRKRGFFQGTALNDTKGKRMREREKRATRETINKLDRDRERERSSLWRWVWVRQRQRERRKERHMIRIRRAHRGTDSDMATNAPHETEPGTESDLSTSLYTPRVPPIQTQRCCLFCFLPPSRFGPLFSSYTSAIQVERDRIRHGSFCFRNFVLL